MRPGQVKKAERITNKLSQFAAYAIQGDYQGLAKDRAKGQLHVVVIFSSRSKGVWQRLEEAGLAGGARPPSLAADEAGLTQLRGPEAVLHVY